MGLLLFRLKPLGYGFFHINKRHIAIDGKRMRSAGKENLSILSYIVNEINNADNDGGKASVHIVSAYDVTNEVSLGQERVPAKAMRLQLTRH